MNEHAKFEEFWKWFSSIAEQLSKDVENRSLIKQLDEHVLSVDPRLSWEVGPGLSKPWQFVVSPNLDRELRAKTRAIVAQAPLLRNWEFHAARQAKKWDYHLEVGARAGEQLISLDASNWRFVLLRYPDGAHEILLKGNNLPELTDDQRWQAAAITLESILGEDLLLDRINEFELVDDLEPRFASRQQPIQHLREAIVGT
jgi:hypothetical protein